MCRGIYVKNLDYVVKFAQLMNSYIPLVAEICRAKREREGKITSQAILKPMLIYYYLRGFSPRELSDILNYSVNLGYLRYEITEKLIAEDKEKVFGIYLRPLLLFDIRDGKRVYICPVCGLEFESENDLLNHIYQSLKDLVSFRRNVPKGGV